MSGATFSVIGSASTIFTILVIVGIGCYLWYLAVEWSKEYEEKNNHITQSTKPPIEEPPKPQVHEHEAKSEYVQIQEKQPPPPYSLEQPYYHIRERFAASSPKSKEEPLKPQTTIPNSYKGWLTEEEEESRNSKSKQTLIVPPSSLPKKKAYIPPPPPPSTLNYTVNLTNKRNLTDNKICLLLIDDIGIETIEKMQQNTIINIKGIKIYTKQLKGGYKTKETQTVLTVTTTPTQLLAIAKSDEAKTHERNKMTSSLKQKIMIRDNYTCQMCGKVMRDTVGLQIDHIIPINKGGKSVEENLQVLCSICNGRKSDKILGE